MIQVTLNTIQNSAVAKLEEIRTHNEAWLLENADASAERREIAFEVVRLIEVELRVREAK